MIERRQFLKGLGSLIAAPVVVRAASLMPVRGIIMDAPPLPFGAGPILQALPDLENIFVLNAQMIAGIMGIPEQWLREATP